MRIFLKYCVTVSPTFVFFFPPSPSARHERLYCKSCYILKGNSLKKFKLAYYHWENGIYCCSIMVGLHVFWKKLLPFWNSKNNLSTGRFVVLSGTLVSSTDKPNHHDIAEIVLKVALNTIILTLTIYFYMGFRLEIERSICLYDRDPMASDVSHCDDVLNSFVNYTPRKQSLEGYIGFTLSVCPSVCPHRGYMVCPCNSS